MIRKANSCQFLNAQAEGKKASAGKGMDKTERQYAVIFPKKDNEGHAISSERLKKYAFQMAKHFNGVTVNQSVLGCYRPKGTSKLQCEENIRMVSARDIDTNKEETRAGIMQKDRDFVNRLAKKAGKEFGQESIFVTEDLVQDNEFIEGKRKESISPEKREKDTFSRLI